MNAAQVKSLGVFAVFFLVGFGPISMGCLLGLFVVAFRPDWFLELIHQLYAGKHNLPKRHEAHTGLLRFKVTLCFLLLLILDIAPVPVTASLAIPIILMRPLWFYRVATGIYPS